MRSETIVAFKGEIVTCLNGHEIGEIAHDIPIFSPMTGDEIINWRENQEVFQNEECKCSICGEPWLLYNELHLKNR